MRAPLTVSVLLAALLLGGGARAQTPTSNLAQAEALLAEVTAHPKAAAVARETQKAREALERARGARSSGDAKHGELLEGLARMWAGVARDVLAAAQAEEQAQAAQQQLAEARAQAERERTLLEENLSRRGRAEAELQRAQAEAAARPPLPAPRDKKEKGKGGKKGKKK